MNRSPITATRRGGERILTLNIPETVKLPDGTAAQVKAVAADIVDGQFTRIVYQVEKASGAWVEVAGEEVTDGSSRASATPSDAS